VAANTKLSFLGATTVLPYDHNNHFLRLTGVYKVLERFNWYESYKRTQPRSMPRASLFMLHAKNITGHALMKQIFGSSKYRWRKCIKYVK
jgi:hypothetical protein